MWRFLLIPMYTMKFWRKGFFRTTYSTTVRFLSSLFTLLTRASQAGFDLVVSNFLPTRPRHHLESAKIKTFIWRKIYFHEKRGFLVIFSFFNFRSSSDLGFQSSLWVNFFCFSTIFTVITMAIKWKSLNRRSETENIFLSKLTLNRNFLWVTIFYFYL